ncbi:MAG TPA: DUF3795 domain-containing protein [Anaerolineae bacterium]|nr:DUF3795 domain-containing protein [Anaerolineae bacterium]
MEERERLVAPCGIDCGLCKRYLATIRGVAKEMGLPRCIGCRPRNKQCKFIKGSCSLLKENKVSFCFECEAFPCARLKTLNRRYETRYNYSLVNNLSEIRRIGLGNWVELERERWRCPECGGVISIHDVRCYDCGHQDG